MGDRKSRTDEGVHPTTQKPRADEGVRPTRDISKLRRRTEHDTMTIPVQQFAQHLMTSGLMAPGEAKDVWEQHSAHVPFTLESFATALRESGRLTTFQVHSLQAERCPLLRLGSYELLDSLGHGGMGHVFRANHRDMDRTVALKILPPAVTSDRGAIDRFKREVKAAARLHHPRIVVAHDAGEFQGTHYLVMEHVDGPDLHALVRQRGQLSLAEATQFVTQAAEGLEYAHAQGVIHRDIKPSNLLVGPDGVKILDLGLALLSHPDSVTGHEETVNGPLTESGTVMGTADFLPPEQAADTHSVDHRADIYSLGATLYFLLVGNSMYPEKTIVRKIFAHKDNPIPKFHEPRPDVPRDLQELFERMVAKRPEDRPASMTEVLHELRSLSGLSGITPGLNQALSAAGSPLPTGYEITSPQAQTMIVPAPVDSKFEDFVKSFSETDTFSSKSGLEQTQDFSGAASGSGSAADDDIPATTSGRRSHRPTGPDSSSPRARPWLKPLAITVSLFLIAGLGIYTVGWTPTSVREKPPVGWTPSSVRPSKAPPAETNTGDKTSRTDEGVHPTEPPPLDEWLKGRDILTVKQDGSAMFTTIQAALDALKPGQVVEVLDTGPYEEALVGLKLPDDTGLCSRVQTVLTPQWTALVRSDEKIRGMELQLQGRFRMSGLAVRSAAWNTAPNEWQHFVLCMLECNRDATIDDCDLHVLPPDDRPPNIGAALGLKALGEARIQVTRCSLSSVGAMADASSREIALFKNWFPDYPAGTINVSGTRHGRITIVRNVFFEESHKSTVFFGTSENLRQNSVVFESNTVLTGGQTLQGVPGQPNQELTLRNNILSGSIVANSPTLVSRTAPPHWKIAGNLWRRQVAADNAFTIPETPVADDTIFLTTDRNGRDFGRIRPDSAAVFANGDYAGALPPGPAPAEGDWFTRLRERWKDHTQ